MSTNPYSEPGGQQQLPHRGGSNTGLIIGLVVGISLFVLLVCGGVMVGLLLPAVQSARSAARRMQSQNNMKQIGLALFNYESAYGSFPPAFTVDENGNKLHSWRTLILPFIEQKALYDQIDLSKPWDDPVNLPFSEMDMPVFISPSVPLQPGQTSYVAIVDPSGVFTGSTPTSIRDITDGTSNTLFFIEVDQSLAVPWMSPDDLDMQTFVNSPMQPVNPGIINAAFADGSIQPLSVNLSGQDRQAFITKAGDDAPTSGTGLGY